MTQLDPNGGTFAERSAAAAGETTFVDPTPDADKATENSTFAERAAARKSRKAVDGGSDAVEDKAVSKSRTAKKS